MVLPLGAHEVIAPDVVTGEQEVILHDEDLQPHSIDFLPDGRMLSVPGAPDDERLLRVEPNGAIVTHVDLGILGRWWNELVVDKHGGVYVDSVGFDFRAFLAGRGAPSPGLVAYVSPDGRVRQVADGIEFGNGMVLTPDGHTLVVAESMGGRLTAFDVTDDGSLTGRLSWADGVGPDGICMDADGAIWTSLGMGADTTACVAEGGEILERIPHDRSPFACMLGGDDGRTLFVLLATFNPADLHGGGRTGQVLTHPAPSPHAGRP